MQRERAVGVSSREGSVEGSLRAVDRTDVCISVDFTGVSTVKRKAVSSSIMVFCTGKVQGIISEIGWYRGLDNVRPRQ